MSKPTLIEEIKLQRHLLETTLASLTPIQMMAPKAIGIWSVKDTLAHITAWEQRLFRWLNAILHEQVPDLPPPYGMDDEALDQLNQKIYLENRDKPLSVVRSEYHTHFQEVLSTLAAVPEELLLESGHFDLPGDIALWEMVATNTCWHYQEHNQDLQNWLEKDQNGVD